VVSRLIRWLFFRNSLGTYLHSIETLIAEKEYAGASVASCLALQKFPKSQELLALKLQAEAHFSSYLYTEEF
jgi:hypothetical protein